MLYVMLNYVMHEIECPKYYLPVILIDLRPFHMICEKTNAFTLLLHEPRTNIDLLSSVFRFYFEEDSLADRFHGQVRSNYSIIHNIEKPWESRNENQHPCILFLEGTNLVEIMLYVPYQNRRYLVEIQYYFHPKRRGSCSLCFEEDAILINLHQNHYYHEVCTDCVFQIHNLCPLCRGPLHE